MLPKEFTPEILKQLEVLKLRSRRAFLGSRQGGHLSLKRGHGIEFSDYRQYELGDNPRHIDWGLYARSDKLYVKRYQEETDISVLIVLDTTASMLATDNSSKWIMAKNLAIAFSYITLLGQDSVAIAALGALNTPRFVGIRSIYQIGTELESLSPTKNIDYRKCLQQAASRVNFPGICILISDFLMPINEVEFAVNIFRAKNLDITAVRVLAPTDIDPFNPEETVIAIDCETGEELSITYDEESRLSYNKNFNDHANSLSDLLMKRSVPLVTINSKEDLRSALTDKLSKTSLLR